MITIHQPHIATNNGYSTLSSFYDDDANNIHQEIFYRTTADWGQYLCDAVADPFVLLAILPAIKSAQDIRIIGSISSDLAFSLETTLIHLFSFLYGNPRCKIHVQPERIVEFKQAGKAIGCGCSLGIDSLSAIKRYSSDDIPVDYKISHLTFFNIGALGEYDFDEAHQTYHQELIKIQEFAQEISIPLVTLESNSSLLFINHFNFNQSHTIRNASAVLALGSLFCKYYYASDFPIEQTHTSASLMGHMNSFLLPLLSLCNVSFISADPDKERTEKTRYLAFDELTQKYLNVCWKNISSNGNPDYSKAIKAIPYTNCTRCDKCLRTALTLDILGVVDSFSNVFDLDYYYSARKTYMFKVLSQKDQNVMYQQIADLMDSTSYHIPRSLSIKLKFNRLHLMWLWVLLLRIKNCFMKGHLKPKRFK